MFPLRSQTRRLTDVLKTVCLAGTLAIPGMAFSSDLTEHMSDKQKTEAVQEGASNGLSPGHRHIEGKVEMVHENTIRVNTEEAGGMSPRFLNVNKVPKEDDINPGDTLQIEVNAQNKVVTYRKVP